MARANRRHPVHKYQKTKLQPSGRVVYRCVLPGCTHYLFEELALNQKSLCNRCGAEFVLDREALRRKKPHCLACTRGRKQDEVTKPQVADVLSNLDDLLKGLS